MKLFIPKTIWWPTWQGWALLFILLAGSIFLFFVNVHSFLAVTRRVKNADILVMEAWVPEVVARAAAREFKDGNYRSLVVIGLKQPNEGEGCPEDMRTSIAVHRIRSFGVPIDRVIVCVSPATDEHRSFAMAMALRDAVQKRAVMAKGINIIEPAAHARKTWLVYGRALRSEAEVGIIAVPTGDYDPARWWRSSQGAKWVLGYTAGWMYELIAGQK